MRTSIKGSGQIGHARPRHFLVSAVLVALPRMPPTMPSLHRRRGGRQPALLKPTPVRFQLLLGAPAAGETIELLAGTYSQRPGRVSRSIPVGEPAPAPGRIPYSVTPAHRHIAGPPRGTTSGKARLWLQAQPTERRETRPGRWLVGCPPIARSSRPPRRSQEQLKAHRRRLDQGSLPSPSAVDAARIWRGWHRGQSDQHR